jgi:hypothetical protein
MGHEFSKVLAAFVKKSVQDYNDQEYLDIVARAFPRIRDKVAQAAGQYF